MSKELLLDEEARKKIAENIDENFFVEAGAGSGKTTSLVTRMVNMVKSGIPVEKISAITYTKAAANEFYERFEKALAKEDDERCAQALKDIDLAFMGTIDSFCNMIISEHPSFVGVPSSVTNRSKDEMDLIYKKEPENTGKSFRGSAAVSSISVSVLKPLSSASSPFLWIKGPMTSSMNR